MGALVTVARYASQAERQAAYRRRQQGISEDFPRQDNRHGRRSLKALATLEVRAER